jgi:dihydroneopterin aldolase
MLKLLNSNKMEKYVNYKKVRKIQFHVATNWDFNLIDELAKYPVASVYGVADHGIQPAVS